MNTIFRNLARLPGILGWVGGLGCALLVSALVLVFTLLMPARDENSALDGQVEKLERQLHSTRSSAQPQATVQQQIQAFLASLPAQDAINKQLNELNALAARHHLTLKTGDYKPVAGKSERINRLQIAVKTEGSYVDLRNFLRDVPNELPALSLRRLSVIRQKPSDTLLDTTAEFALFYAAVEP